MNLEEKHPERNDERNSEREAWDLNGYIIDDENSCAVAGGDQNGWMVRVFHF